MYNLIAWHHGRTSCVLVNQAGEHVGAVVGYCVPATPAVWFVWQVAVRPDHRHQGLGLRMLEHVVRRLKADGVTALQTTITPGNAASRALFSRLAAKHRGVMSISPFLPVGSCGEGRDAEDLYTIVWPEGREHPAAATTTTSTSAAAPAPAAHPTVAAPVVPADDK